MDTYRKSRERFRQQDEKTKQLRRSLKGSTKAQRRAAVAAASIRPNYGQRGQGRGA